MKTTKTIWLSLFILLLASCSVSNKSASGKKTLQQKIESKDFTIFVVRSIPTNLINSTYNSDVVLKVKKDRAYANLPFHQELSVNVNDMTEGQVGFDAVMEEYTSTQHPDNSWTVRFKVDGDPYSYQVNIEATAKGKAVVEISSPQRSTMTYYGDLD
ncbi:MAG: DUF4251 domain-containing protein [Paludibacter sp.]|nr:DUF4251 domain-containing protein [Paludibacter sp.]